MKEEKILVTGAAGFMGSHVVDYLLLLGFKEVYGLDDLSGGHLRNVDKDCKFTKLDLRDRAKIEKYITDVSPTLIYHLAADATEGRSQFTPIECTQRNYLAHLNLLVPAIRIGLRKIVVTSSMSVYGAQKPPFSERMPSDPVDIYGISKTAMERATEILSKVHGFRYTIIRPHNVYGPKQNLSDPYRNVIGIFINSLLRGKSFYIYGDGEQKRAFTYIDDFTPYFVKAGFDTKSDEEIINIGPTETHTINELAKIVLKNFYDGKPYPKEVKPKHLPERSQEVKEAFCTNEKATKILGYKTTISLEDGIKKMIVWAKALGPQKPIYLKKGLELEGENTPDTWSKHLI